ncbi:hypothetical protein BSG1_10453 [Bacillus sp. SG-1]|nr:hypothetical protein BSG1_10453 [Bacillus sp. SG-1]
MIGMDIAFRSWIYDRIFSTFSNVIPSSLTAGPAPDKILIMIWTVH